MRVIWIDDRPARLDRIVRLPEFTRRVDGRICASVEDAVTVLLGDWLPDLVVLDVVGEDGVNLVAEAAQGPLAGYPWLMVSDEARHQELDPAIRALSASSHLVDLPAAMVAGILQGVREEFDRGHPAPCRAHIDFQLHQIRESLEEARSELWSGRHAGAAGAEGHLDRADKALYDIAAVLNQVALQ